MVRNWIFLRGLVREAAHWDDFPERLAAALPKSRPYCLDLPGNGKHWKTDSPTSIRAMAESVRAEWAAMGIAGPTYLFSISMGAMVAIEWMQRYPRDLAGGVLVNTSLRSLSPIYRRLSPSAWPWIGKMFAEADVARREELILKLTSETAIGESLVQKRAATFLEHPVRRQNVLRQLWAAARYRPSQKKPDVPILLLNSLGDKMVHPSCANRIQEAWGVARFTHPTAGHDLPLDDPAWCIDCVKKWINGY